MNGNIKNKLNGSFLCYLVCQVIDPFPLVTQNQKHGLEALQAPEDRAR